MTEIICTVPSWGTVQDPETGQRIDVYGDDPTEVDDDVADRLVSEFDEVEYAEDVDQDSLVSTAEARLGDDDEEVTSEDVADDSTEPDEEASGFDAEAFVDRTPLDDVVDDIESGEYDEHLDEIGDAEENGRDRDGVTDAIEERQEE